MHCGAARARRVPRGGGPAPGQVWACTSHKGDGYDRSFVRAACGQRTPDAFRHPGRGAGRRVRTDRGDAGPAPAGRTARRAGHRAGHHIDGRAGRVVRHRPGRHRPCPRHPGRVRPGGHEHASGFPPDQGRGHRGPADRGVRDDAAPRFQPGPGRYRAGRAPLPGRQPDGAGRAGRDRDRGPGTGQPATGEPAFPAVGGGRDPVLVHAAAGGTGLPVPGGHGRDRPYDRHPGIRRRFRRERSAVLLPRPRPSGPVGHGGERRRGVQRARIGPERRRR